MTRTEIEKEQYEKGEIPMYFVEELDIKIPDTYNDNGYTFKDDDGNLRSHRISKGISDEVFEKMMQTPIGF